MDSAPLATCRFVRGALKRPDVGFHTFDDSKGKNYEEKVDSLLNFEKYAAPFKGDPDVDAVCALTRCKPLHPTKSMI